jgi:hypothetical protein
VKAMKWISRVRVQPLVTGKLDIELRAVPALFAAKELRQ